MTDRSELIVGFADEISDVYKGLRQEKTNLMKLQNLQT
jgi:hypothetical protein